MRYMIFTDLPGSDCWREGSMESHIGAVISGDCDPCSWLNTDDLGQAVDEAREAHASQPNRRVVVVDSHVGIFADAIIYDLEPEPKPDPEALKTYHVEAEGEMTESYRVYIVVKAKNEEEALERAKDSEFREDVIWDKCWGIEESCITSIDADAEVTLADD